MSTLDVLIYGAAAVAGAAALLALLVWRELTKEPPKGGSPYTLPNGMQIQHWQKAETDFLYTEIFGKENAYARGGIVFKPGATILDAGANIGMFTLFAAQQCNGAARIVSFEPIPSTHAVLAANASAANSGKFADTFKPAHGAKLEITALNVGLSDKPAEVVFEHHPHFTVWSTSNPTFAKARLERIRGDLPRAAATSESALVRAAPAALVAALGSAILSKLGKTERVPAKLVPLSKVMDDMKISTVDLLKVDVEGAELLVLQGLDDRHWAGVQQVAMEVENFDTVRRITDLLQKKGFNVSSFASERERNPGVLSEVSMLYGVRPGYTGPK